MVLGPLFHADVHCSLVGISKILKHTNGLVISHDLHRTYIYLRQSIGSYTVFVTQHIQPLNIELADGLTLVFDLSVLLVHLKAGNAGEYVANVAIILIGKSRHIVYQCVTMLTHLTCLDSHFLQGYCLFLHHYS